MGDPSGDIVKTDEAGTGSTRECRHGVTRSKGNPSLFGRQDTLHRIFSVRQMWGRCSRRCGEVFVRTCDEIPSVESDFPAPLPDALAPWGFPATRLPLTIKRDPSGRGRAILAELGRRRGAPRLVGGLCPLILGVRPLRSGPSELGSRIWVRSLPDLELVGAPARQAFHLGLWRTTNLADTSSRPVVPQMHAHGPGRRLPLKGRRAGGRPLPLLVSSFGFHLLSVGGVRCRLDLIWLLSTVSLFHDASGGREGGFNVYRHTVPLQTMGRHRPVLLASAGGCAE